MKRSIFAVFTGLTLLTSTVAKSQDIFTDILRETADEARLQQDYRTLQRDLANGNTSAAQYDLMRIQQDNARLARDQWQLNYDLNRGAYLYPNTNTSNYTNSYFVGLQNTQQGGPAFIANSQGQVNPPLNPVPGGAGSVPGNPLPSVFQSIKISNPSSTGVALSFVLGTTTYSIPAGRIDDFQVIGPTIISFNKGGTAGVARYTLTTGNTFEFRYDTSGWYLIQKIKDPVSDLIPPNPGPTSTSTSSSVSPTPIAPPTTTTKTSDVNSTASTTPASDVSKTTASTQTPPLSSDPKPIVPQP